MFLDGRNLNQSAIETDICIVGGGAAGIAIANEFMHSTTSVTILESGGLEPEKAVLDLNIGEVVGLNTSLETSRLRWFGGSTNHWEGMCAPLQPIDFEPRPWVNHSGWPFSLDELVPYYKAASVLLNMSGRGSSDFNAPRNLLKHNGEFEFHLWRFPEKLEMGAVHFNTFQASKNIQVILNASVTNIAASQNLSSVEHLKVQTLSGQQFDVKAKRYILACGGIENARLLLLSRNQAVNGLGNQNDLVGRFFMQHPHMEVGRVYMYGSSKSLEPFIHKIGVLGKPLKEKPPFLYNIALTSDIMRKFKILNGSLTVSYIGENFKDITTPIKLMQKTFKMRGPVSEVSMYVRSEQAPNPDSRITLSTDKRDAFGLPVTRLDWKMTELDWYSIKKLGILLAQNISSKKQGIMKFHPWANTPLDWPGDLIGGDHHMGTTRMHDNPKYGVVDRNCRVHGISNLYIAGSSVYPTVGWANPTYTLIALAIRLAKHLKQNP